VTRPGARPAATSTEPTTAQPAGRKTAQPAGRKTALRPAPPTLPGLGPIPKPKRIASAERTLATGLHIVVVRRTGVPLVELRLRIPFQSPLTGHPAQAELLSDSLLAGTHQHSRDEIASRVQGVGGSLSTSVDADRLVVAGSGLASGLPVLLDVVAEVLTGATYPRSEVARNRDRLVERLAMARSQAGVIAHEAMARRLWGEHPYVHDMPEAAAVAATTPAQVRRLHERRIRPQGATLIIVGDVSPARTLDRVEAALGGWANDGDAFRSVTPLPAITTGPVVLVDRPGSVQSALRLAGPAVARNHPDAAALSLANLVFGGYFSSRWVENIREDKGYTYSPRSSIEHRELGSTFRAAADVATEVTAAAVLETAYELGRMASTPVRDDEVDAARQYAIGSLSLAIATQAGLASTLAGLAGAGLGLDWVAGQPARMAAVTIDEVTAAAATYLAPSRLVSVIVGDAATIRDPLGLLVSVADA
jgi:zinc protease